MPDFIADLYRQNEWANLVIIDACRELNDEQLDTTAPGTYGSIKATLHHIVSSETGYAFREGDADIQGIASDDPWPGFDRLTELVQATSAAATRHAMDPAGEQIVVDLPDHPSDVDFTVVFIQMVNHSTDHRSQISTILTTLGVEPPDLSSWAWGLADGRVACGICDSQEHYGADH